MSEKAKPTEAEITYAINYALRSEGISGAIPDGEGGWISGEQFDLNAEDLKPFTMRLLQALNVI